MKGRLIALDRLALGTSRLSTHLRTWLAAKTLDGQELKAGKRAKESAKRALGGAVAAWFVGGMLYALGLLWWGGVVLWLVSAWVAGGAQKAPASAAVDGLDPADFLEFVHEVSGGANVHMSTINAQLQEETGRAWSSPEVTALCRAAGIPIREGVRVRGAQPPVTTGIHRADLPPLPQPLSGSPGGVVSAGSEANNNANTPIVVPIGGGAAWINKTGPSTRQGVSQ